METETEGPDRMEGTLAGNCNNPGQGLQRPEPGQRRMIAFLRGGGEGKEEESGNAETQVSDPGNGINGGAISGKGVPNTTRLGQDEFHFALVSLRCRLSRNFPLQLAETD